MLITDIIQDSFQEYQDHISLVLFSYSCNFKCNGCYNYKHVTNFNNVIDSANKIVDKYITPLHSAVVFLGGEPTIWKEDLLSSAKHVKCKDLKVKIFTNGFLPNIIELLNDNELVDAYSIDLKTIRNVSELINVKMNDEEYLYKVNLSIQRIIDADIPIEIRTTKFENVDIEEVQEYVHKKYPFIQHIIQEDFLKNFMHHKSFNV